MKQNLLTKTLRWYVVFATAVLLVTAPIFYFVTQHLYIDEANETLKLHKKEFERYRLPHLKHEDIDRWNHSNRDEKILRGRPKHKKNRFSTVFYYDTLSHEREPYRELTSPIEIDGKHYTYTAKINLVEREDVIESIALLFLGLTGALLVGLYFITKVMSAKLWKPFYSSLDYIEKFEIDKSVKGKLPSTTINEFDRLNSSIERLIEKNTSIFNSQREFVENAAHELQTPLAVVQGKLEALFQQTNLTPEQSEALEKLNGAVTRLIRLNRNLLLLSRIDREQFQQEESISVGELISKNLEFFTEQALPKQIRINIDTKGEATLTANLSLTEILLSNLFLNAIRHNITGGTINITLTDKGISIANTGQPTPLPSENIFNRFSKIDPSSQGTGLGLAIVKKIAELNKWNIQYTFENNLHIFSIDF
ncbi:MAG: HAMP domain-containing sensor histidine kinase [Cyclobacteriaceae bacterium]